MTSISEAAVRDLLDYDKKLDIELLDKVVHCMYNGFGEEQKNAEKFLTAMKDDAHSWTRVDAILEFSQYEYSKYFALQILESVIKIRWKVLPRDQREGIKKYIVGLIIKISIEQQSVEQNSTYLFKLNMVLVQILKHEWPTNWPTFISDIVGSGRSNEALCRNNLTILRLLSEEVFDFSAGQLVQAKVTRLKDSMCAEFGTIFDLCQFVLRNSRTVALVSSTLDTLLRFVHWIPLGFIFETDLIPMLISNFLGVSFFRNYTLKCLIEIASIQEPKYTTQFIQLFESSTNELTTMIPIDTDIKTAYHNGSDDEQKLIQNLALFYSTFLQKHCAEVEGGVAETNKFSQIALTYLMKISEVDDIEVFKTCLDYWTFLAAGLYCSSPNDSSIPVIGTDALRQRRALYNPILSNLRVCLISRMARPEEVLIVENDQGDVVREFMKDTDAITLYKTMRETLVYLTHLNPLDTQTIMTEKMSRIMSGVDWSWKNLNTLCWAIGSISGALSEEEERRFLVGNIRDLLSLCEEKRGKDNKAIVASNIMYVVGQYPRFLRAHWRFLRTVVNKLFEFMHEYHEGVQDMACDTFIKICENCKRQFVTIQPGESRTFIEDILVELTAIICDLEPQQIQTFYEAVAIIIAAHPEREYRNRLVEKLYSPVNVSFEKIIGQASVNLEVLRDQAKVRQLIHIFQLNINGARHLSVSYSNQLGYLYLDSLNVYKVMSSNINLAINSGGEMALKDSLLKLMRSLKKEILRLIYTWVESVSNKHTYLSNFSEIFLQPLLEVILVDYSSVVASAREAEVLICLAVLITNLEGLATSSVHTILEAVFQSTLEMINRDMTDFPEHRAAFFQLLQAVNAHCFPALMDYSMEKFKLILDSVIWAIKHMMRTVSETGLNILKTMLINVAQQQGQSFYQAFFLDIISHLFSVITDSSQIGNLGLQCEILAQMFKCLEKGQVSVSLRPELATTSSHSIIEGNVKLVHESVSTLLKNAFPHLRVEQIRVFVDGLFSFDQDGTAFYNHIRDFLVQIREISGDDLSDLYLNEVELEMSRARDAKKIQKDQYQNFVPEFIADPILSPSSTPLLFKSGPNFSPNGSCFVSTIHE